MEEKLPKDGLEEFLKKSFEDYSESPSSDLWDKIEADLPLGTASKFRVARRWWPVAAAVLILSVFTCQHFYFKNKISQLSRQMESTTTELHQLLAKEKQSSTETKQTAPIAQQQPEETTAPNPAQAGEVTPPNRNAAHPLPPATLPGPEKTAALPESKKTLADQTAEPEPLFYKGQDSQPVPVQADAVVSPTEYVAAPGFLGTPALQFLFAQKTTPILQTATSMPLVEVPTKKRRFSVGFNVMPMAFQEKIMSDKPDHHGGMMHFQNETRSSGQTIFAGVTLGYGIDGHWCLLSGLNYRKNSFTSTHQPAFAFGKMMMGGPGHHQYSVQYELSTSSGVVSVDLRADQSDTTMQIPPAEQIGLEIKTRQSQEYLSLPLGIQYRLGTGRLGWNVKGGIIANFLMSSELGISEISSSNNRFEHWTGNIEPSGHEGLSNVSFDYFAGIGLNYEVTKSWSISLEPTLIGSLSNSQKDPDIQTSYNSVGLNAAVLYTF